MYAIPSSRERAICQFFSAPYDQALAYHHLSRMNHLEQLEVCYKRGRPDEPLLLPKVTINTDPTTYLLYPKEKHISSIRQ